MQHKPDNNSMFRVEMVPLNSQYGLDGQYWLPMDPPPAPARYGEHPATREAMRAHAREVIRAAGPPRYHRNGKGKGKGSRHGGPVNDTGGTGT